MPDPKYSDPKKSGLKWWELAGTHLIFHYRTVRKNRRKPVLDRIG